MEQLIIIYLLLLVIPIIADINVKSKYNKNKKIDSQGGLTGFEIARKILDEHGLNNVYIVETGGELTDCYDSTRKTIRLSSHIFHGSSIASISVAAHECGHAIQDKEEYFWFNVRSFLVPTVNLFSKLAYITLLMGFFLNVLDLVYFSVALTGISLIFHLITLPVEFDASKRAKTNLENLKLINKKEGQGVSEVLSAAALTYVASVVSILLNMLYNIMLAERRR